MTVQFDHVQSYLSTLGSNFRLLRNNEKKTLKQVANDMGISTSYLSKIEHGKFENLTLLQIFVLCKYYRFSYKRIFTPI